MIRFALLTALAMTASGAAVADPQTSQRGRDHAVVHDHYDRYEHSHWSKEFKGRWVPIAQGSSAEGRREFVLGGAGTGPRYRKVRIEGIRGEPGIAKVTINFADDSAQIIDLNMTLPSGAGEVFDLNGDDRKIKRVIVYPTPGSRGMYSVYGA